MNVKTKFLLSLLVVTIWALFTGYFQIFSDFPLHQDEGYLMMTVKQFLDGHVLYDEIYTQYGPAYYLYEQLIYFVSGTPVTHDFTRLITLTVWTLTGLLGGVFTFRLTRSPFFGAAAFVFAFLILFRTIYEPGHPQELCGLLVILILLLLTNAAGKSFTRRAILAIICLAILFLTKVNLGVFVGLSLAIALINSIKPSVWQKILLTTLVILAAAMPFLILKNFLDIGWIKLCVALIVSIVAVVLNDALKSREFFVSVKTCIILAAAFFVASFSIIGGLLLQGTSLAALIYGTFLQHLKFGDNFFQAAPIQRFVIYWSIFAFVLAIGIAFAKSRFPRQTSMVLILLKLIFGVFVVAASLWGYKDFLNNFILLSFAPPFLWLLLVESPKADGAKTIGAEKNRLVRVALFFAAILLTLQIFPISGTQAAYASYLIIVGAIICFSEGLAEARRLFSQLDEYSSLRLGALAASIILIGAVGVYRFAGNYSAYNQNTPVNFEGSTRLRMPVEKAALYTFLVENLQADCDNFVTMPGFYSLNFWTKIEPPTTYNATAWMTLLDDAQQNAIITKLKSYPRACAVYYPKLANDGLRNTKIESFPLARYILNDFKTVASVSEHNLMFAPDSTAIPVYLAEILPSGKIAFSLPNRRDWQISRIQIFDRQQNQVFADTENNSLFFLDDNEQTVGLPLTIKAGENPPRRYETTLPTSNNSTLPAANFLILRLYDEKANLIAFLPFNQTAR